MNDTSRTDSTPAMPADVEELAAIAARLRSLIPAPQADRAGLVALISAAQSIANTAAALQDLGLARLAATETEWAEDGTLAETTRRLGHLTIDAADLAAPALGATHGQAVRRMEQAVRVAAGRHPVEDGTRVVPEQTGLGGLHAAMRDGRLDVFRASVVVLELADAPAAVAEAVVAALEPHLHRDAGALRKRTRALLARISPDLLRRRAERARSETGLRRWVTEPGVDTWYGTFPSEDAAAAWAAIDDLARRHVSEGVCSTLEQARGKALTDLVTAQATVTISLVLTTPADTTDADRSGAVVSTMDHDDSADAVTGAAAGTMNDAGSADATSVAHHDGDLGTGGVGSAGTSSAADGRERRGDDLVEVRGMRPTEATLVPRAWIHQLLAADGPSARRARSRRPFRPPGRDPDEAGGVGEVRVSTAPCHPGTGALHPGPGPAMPAALGYRPPEWLVALVRTRDGRCRFPGCSVAARFCDLDHLRPWPSGATGPDNLACLCRRHHRIKQRPGWRVRMLPGAVLEWTDPTGRVRTTAPQDVLHGAVLPAEQPTGRARAAPDGPCGLLDGRATAPSELVQVGDARLALDLEHLLERQLAAPVWTRACRGDRGVRVIHARLARRTEVRVAAQTPGGSLDRQHPASQWPDEPPF